MDLWESSVYAGLAKGYGSYFAPNNPITKQELAAILVNAIGQQDAAKASMNGKTGFSDDTSISPWARGFVATAVKVDLLKGYSDNNFEPQGTATRAEACAMIVNLLNSQKYHSCLEHIRKNGDHGEKSVLAGNAEDDSYFRVS